MHLRVFEPYAGDEGSMVSRDELLCIKVSKSLFLGRIVCIFEVGSLAVKELCFIKDDVSSRDDLSCVGDPDPVYVCGVVSNEVTDLSSRIKLIPSVPLELGILYHRICSASISFDVC